MKKLLKLSLVTMLAIFALSVVSYAATGGGKHHKAKTPVHFSTNYWSNYTGTAFTNGSSSSTLLSNTANWSTPSTTIPNIGTICPGSILLCGILITVPTGSSLPAFADILSALKTYYDTNGSFPIGTINAFHITVDGVNLTVAVYAKDN